MEEGQRNACGWGLLGRAGEDCARPEVEEGGGCTCGEGEMQIGEEVVVLWEGRA